MIDRDMPMSPLHIRHLWVVTASIFAFGCTQPDSDQSSQRSNAVTDPKIPAAPLPAPALPLDREGIILAAMRAATAAALGDNGAAAQAGLKGKRFQVRMRFGCSESDDQTISGWSHDVEKGVMRVRVRADVTGDTLPAKGQVDGPEEGALGFTLGRPWMLTTGCPNPAFATMAGGPGIAIVQLFTDSDSRAQRPQATYEAVAQVTREELPAKGLDLILSGRLKARSDGNVIDCAGSGVAPGCIIYSVIDRVIIEDPIRQEIIAEFGAS